jgi:hypothetical protein
MSTWDRNPTVKWIGGQEKGTLMVECETMHPQSHEGRTAYVYLDVEAVTALLLVLREMAIEARR